MLRDDFNFETGSILPYYRNFLNQPLHYPRHHPPFLQPDTADPLLEGLEQDLPLPTFLHQLIKNSPTLGGQGAWTGGKLPAPFTQEVLEAEIPFSYCRLD
jgi:hypothetical protein